MITSEQYRELLRREGVIAGRIPTPGLSVLKPRKKPVAGRKRQKTSVEVKFESQFRFKYPHLTILYESLKLRIDDSCWYLPDFFVPEKMTFYETKGPHIYEDSVIKFKAARAIHSWANFEMWQLKDGIWREIRKLS